MFVTQSKVVARTATNAIRVVSIEMDGCPSVSFTLPKNTSHAVPIMI
ncbi:conserved hypothetical protein [Bradyrhizobium sp. STM 3809]|nr:conserved hypothetical protein [Bradyrhizobium sp. STM 3809]